MAACRSRLWGGRRILESNHWEEKSIARMFCTGAKKRRMMSREKRVEAVKAFVEQYMLQFPGKFPSCSLVKTEVGGCSEVLKPILEELKITLKASQDQKQSADVNGEAPEAVKSIEPEKLSIYAKSNDATVMESNRLNQNNLLYFNKISGIDLPNNKKQTLFQASEKDFVIEKEDPSIAPHLNVLHSSNEKGQTMEISGIGKNIDMPDNKQTLFQASEKEFIVEKEDPSIAPHLNELQGAILPEKQEKTSLHSLNEKGQPLEISGMGENIDMPDNEEMSSLNSSIKESGTDLANNQKQALSQASGKEFVVKTEDPSSAPPCSKLLDKQEKTSLPYSNEKGEPVKISGMGENIDLPDNQAKSSLQSSNEKEEHVKISATGENLLPLSFPKITSEKADGNANNEDCTYVVHTKELYSTSIELKNPELNKLKGVPVKASTVLEEIKVEKNETKEVNSSTIASNIRNSFATNLKLVPEQTTKGGPSLNAQDAIQYAKVDNKEVERGSTVPKNLSLPRRSATKVDTDTQIRKQQLMKEVDTDQRNRRFPSTYTLQSHKISDEETEDDSDYAAFDYPEPDGSNQPVITRTNFRLDKGGFSEKPKSQQSDCAAFDYPERDGSNQPVIARTNFRLDKAGLSEKPKSQQYLLVKFLPLSATEHDLCMAFGDCGSINQVHIIPSRREESKFNYASIIFKTEEGFQKALLKKDVVVSGGDVVLEAVSSYNQNLCQGFTPRTVKNRAVPTTEIKNPHCTVMIKELPHGFSFKQLKNALAFCGTVKNCTMGLSESTIYIAFKTEEAKERALMAHWISIDGHLLQIRRVDAPRTPVVRISNVSSETGDDKILNICKSFGCVKKVERRDKDIVDVHFGQTELGSMINILDSLNGVIMNQCRWQAQPASVFPPETLHGLWSSADGRNYLHSVIQNLFGIINRSYINDNDFNELVAQYYGEAVSRTVKL